MARLNQMSALEDGVRLWLATAFLVAFVAVIATLLFALGVSMWAYWRWVVVAIGGWCSVTTLVWIGIRYREQLA